MIVYGLIANTSIGKLYAGGVLPGLMLAAMFIAYVLLRGQFQPHLAPPAEDDGKFTLRDKLISLRGLIFPFLLVGTVLGAILSGFTSVSGGRRRGGRQHRRDGHEARPALASVPRGGGDDAPAVLPDLLDHRSRARPVAGR